jgi:glycosyltransferase involved in cell wall biosynthesis
MNAPHIVFVSTNAVWGGSEQLWARTALTLVGDGIDVTAVVDNAMVTHRNILALQQSGVRVLAYPLPPTRWRRLRRKFFQGKTQVALDFDELMPAATPSLVVLSTGGCLVPTEFLEMCFVKAWPFVTVGQANYEDWWPDDATARRYREALPRALRCYFVSLGNWRLAEKQLGYKIENGEVVRNPFNVSYDAAPAWPRMSVESELRLGCVGRLHPASKGQDVLLEALAHPNWAARRWRLTFYGDGPWRNGMERLVERFGLQGRVGFSGYVTEVEKIWGENHVLVMPSRYEGLPLAMVEAMLCARPVIATDVAGHAEVIEEGVTGFLADAATVAGVQAALERLWARRADLESMGKMAATSIREKVPRDPIAIFSTKVRQLCQK